MSKAEYVVNVYTQERIPRPRPVEKEVPFHGGVMITETDARGVITYANRRFCEMTGYTKRELVGSPHSLIRHPDMPKEVFESMWKTIRSGKIWRGYVKNIRKDGSYYWVLVYIQPKKDAEGKLLGYVAGRKVARRDQVERMERLYEMCRNGEAVPDEILACNYDEMLKSGDRHLAKAR
ncbi:PAS domain-containing protein [Hydrogenimonas sp.]